MFQTYLFTTDLLWDIKYFYNGNFTSHCDHMSYILVALKVNFKITKSSKFEKKIRKSDK